MVPNFFLFPNRMIITVIFISQSPLIFLSLNYFRNSGIAMVFISGHIGAATSPFLVQLTRINAVLPFAVMGALSVVGAILCWTLPETLGRKTAEVWEDAEDSKGTMV